MGLTVTVRTMLATLAQASSEFQPEFDVWQLLSEIPIWYWVIYAVVGLFYIVAMWRIFTKAGEPGWYSIVPILNTYTLCKIAGRPGWWLLLLMIPCVNFIFVLIVYLDLAKAFGKSSGFGLGLVFLSPIFIPILAFGSAEHYSRSSYRSGGYRGGYAGYGGGGGFTPPGAPAGGWSGASGWSQGSVGAGAVGQGYGAGLPGQSSQGWGPHSGTGQPGAGLPGIGSASSPAGLPGLGAGATQMTPPPMPGSTQDFASQDFAGSSSGFPEETAWGTTAAQAPPAPVAPEQPAPPAPAGPEAGWYENPQGTGWRWWDGYDWTEHTSE